MSTETLEILKRETEQLVSRRITTAIESHGEAHIITGLLVRAKQAAGDLKLQKAQALAPLEKQIGAEKARFDPLIEALAAFEKQAKAALGAWTEREDRRVADERAAEALRLAAAAESLATAQAAGDNTAAALAEAAIDSALEAPQAQAVKAFRGETGTASTSKKWKAEIVKAEDVPREYCVPSLPLINAAIKLGKRHIPGVSITQETQVNVRIRQ